VEPTQIPPAAEAAPEWGAWESGDPLKASAALVLAGERLCDAVNLRFGQRVLDVGTGTGNTALSAARRGARPVALDPMTAVLGLAAERARAERLKLRFVTGSAEMLPFKDHSFDASLSTFGVMFAYDTDAAVDELVRVTREGGRLGIASWTPGGLIGQLYRAVGAEAEDSADRPTEWGRRERLSEWFSGHAQEMTTATRSLRLRGPSPKAFVDYLGKSLGPVVRAFASGDEAARDHLRTELVELFSEANRADDGSFEAPAEYLEVVVHLR
jgi:ubiquinone/menaquinone biosynthesis C-methylase UbiE